MYLLTLKPVENLLHITTNSLAVELGIYKGSDGTLISLKYEIQGGRRYAIYVDVDIPAYTSSDPNPKHSNRLTLTPASRQHHVQTEVQ